MFINKGGTVVEKGLYCNPMDGRIVAMQENGILPADESKRYLKISPIGLLVLAPLFGMMYVLFLPLFGIGVFIISWLVPVIGALVSAAITGVNVCSRVEGRSVFFNWRPTRAHFHGFRKKEKAVSKGGAGVSHNTKRGQ
jgi:hypothetical protein